MAAVVSAKVRKTSKLAWWGNSLGVRIPREVAERVNMKNGESVEFGVKGDMVTMRKIKPRKKWTEAELLKGVTPDMLPGESWTVPVGKETF